MRNSYEFFLNVRGLAWAAPKVTRRGAYDIRSDFKNALRWQIKSQWIYDKILDCPCSMTIWFGFKPPESASKKKRLAMIQGNVLHTVKSDLTNLVKLTEDCLKGIVVKDDNLFFKISAEKYWSEDDHIKIVIVAHEEDLCH